MSKEFKLGRSIAQLVPFYRQRQEQHKEIITTKLVIIMGIVAIVKIAVLILYPI